MADGKKSKQNFIKDEHKETLSKFLNENAKLTSQLGEVVLQEKQVEIVKARLFDQLEQVAKEFSEFQNVLKGVYGNVSVNPEDGSYTVVEE